jgi:hypothetical protein
MHVVTDMSPSKVQWYVVHVQLVCNVSDLILKTWKYVHLVIIQKKQTQFATIVMVERIALVGGLNVYNALVANTAIP